MGVKVQGREPSLYFQTFIQDSIFPIETPFKCNFSGAV